MKVEDKGRVLHNGQGQGSSGLKKIHIKVEADVR